MEINNSLIIVILIIILAIGVSLFCYNQISSSMEHQYNLGEQNCTNNTITGLWQDIADDGCLVLPIPVRDVNNQTQIENAKFCYVK